MIHQKLYSGMHGNKATSHYSPIKGVSVLERCIAIVWQCTSRHYCRCLYWRCSSNMGVTPVWRHNGSLVANSQPISGTPGVYVREPTNHERVLVLQNITQSVVGTYVCLEGTSQDADSATFIMTTGKGVHQSCDWPCFKPSKVVMTWIM